MHYWAPINSPGGIFGNDGYVDGNPVIGVQGSIPSFHGFEQTLRELVNFVEKSGLTQDDTTNGIQIAQAVQNGKVMYGADTGTASTLVVTLDPVPLGYSSGLKVLVLKNPAVAANAGASTLNVNGLGNKDIVRPNGLPMRQGDMAPGSLCLFAYDGTQFQLIAGGNSFQQTMPGQNGSISYSVAGVYDWVVPAGIFAVLARIWGPGGGGGGSSVGAFAASGAGGGEYREGWITVSPGEHVAVTVGTHGAGGAGAGAGGNATASNVTAVSATIIAAGGQGSPAGNGSVNIIYGLGGGDALWSVGSGGSFTVPGHPGGFAGFYGGTATQVLLNGMGGGSWGTGLALFGNGTNGLLPGVGGSGGTNGTGGGNGCDGRVVLVW